MKEGSFKVSSDGVFYSLQGEGVTMGEPACFLRLHFCNLRCRYCDTSYTIDTQRDDFWEGLKDWTVDETRTQLEGVWGCKDKDKRKRAVVTGGEPLLQKELLTELILAMPDWNFEIETNGTIMPTKEILEISKQGRVQFNCSPKLDNSGNGKEKRIVSEVIKALTEVKSSFKFVVTSEGDLDEIEQDFVSLGIPKERIILMPEGTDTLTLKENALRVVEKAKEKGYRLLGRLQVDLWGHARKT